MNLFAILTAVVRILVIRLLTFLEIVPLRLCLRQWRWILKRLNRI